MLIKKKISISLLLISGLLAAIAYLVIIPTVKDIQKINEAVLREKKDLELKYLKGQLIKNINKDFAEIKPAKEKLYSMFIPKNTELEFIKNLEGLIQKYNLTQKIELLNVDEKLTPDDIKKTLPLKITLSGDFIQFIKYLKDIEKNNYYFNIYNLTIDANDSNLGTVNISLEGEAYSLL